MQPIKFEFINKEIQLVHPTMKHRDGSDYMRKLGFRIGYIMPNETEEEVIKRVIKRIKKNRYLMTNSFNDLSEDELRKLIRVVEFPKSQFFPKFSNEIKFTAFKDHINPEILNIRWCGPEQTWEYQMRNVGHIYDYYKEEYLKEIEL